MKSQITRKKINLRKSFFMSYVGQVFGTHCNISFLEINMRIDIFGTERCTVTFGFVYVSIVSDSREIFVFFVFVALRPKSTAMAIAGRSDHLTTLFSGQA